MQENRWSIIGNKTVWNIKENDIHTDTIEMSGNRVSAIVTYGVNDEGKLLLHRESEISHAENTPARHSLHSRIRT